MLKIIKQPHWKLITKICSAKVAKKYPVYGNDWKDSHSLNFKFWNIRLQAQVYEAKLKHGDDRIDELIDVINICAFEISKRLDKKYSGVFASNDDDDKSRIL